jgi:hypothetical protein
MIVVSLSGPIGSGKDASAQLLQEVGISQGKISFAGPLKDIVSQVYKIPRQDMEDQAKKLQPFETPMVFDRKSLRSILKLLPEYLPIEEMYYNINRVTETNLVGAKIPNLRYLLQFVGTEVIRNKVDQNWHLNAAFSSKVLENLDPDGLYCVTDARFPNELEFLRDKFNEDFYGYYVERPEAEERLKTATHASELELVKIRELVGSENVLKNDGSLKELESLLKSLPFATDSKPVAFGQVKTKKKKGKFKFVNSSGKVEIV